MEELSVYNMQNNMLYEFDKGKYVWRVEMVETRDGNYPYEEVQLTEVYRLNGSGLLERVASGRLVDNPNLREKESFAIFDYDQDMRLSFSVTRPLERASIDVMYLLRDTIQREYQRRKK